METVRVGILNDMADGPPGPGDITFWLDREITALRAAGRLSATVEFAHAYGLGLPAGTAAAVERAFAELAACCSSCSGDIALATTR